MNRGVFDEKGDADAIEFSRFISAAFDVSCDWIREWMIRWQRLYNYRILR